MADRVTSVVGELVARGLVDPHRSVEAEQVIRAAETGQPPATTSLRRRLTEVAGYVGGAFVFAAAVIFLAEEWADFSPGQRVLALALVSVVLAAAAVLALTTAPGGVAAARTEATESVRGRLSSVLACGAVLAAAFAVGVRVGDTAGTADEGQPILAAALVVLVLGVVVYLLVPTALVQVMLAAAVFVAASSGLSTVTGEVAAVPLGLLVLAAGLVWLVLAEAAVWQERTTGRLLGSLLALVGAQVPLTGPGSVWPAYALTAGLAVAAVVAYVWSRSAVYLALGVVAVTVVVPEALLDWSEGSLGPVGVLLVAGVTLLFTSLLGLRLRREVAEENAGEDAGGAGARD